MKNAVHKSIGPFKTLTLDGRVDNSCIVFFHGYGADAADLMPLVDMMNVSADATWIFPEAPMEVIIAPGFYGRAWFQIDSRRLENSMKNGEPLDMSNSVPEGLTSVRKSAAQFYSEVRKKYKKVIIGGFSQGAMLAIDIALNADKKPDGLVIMSGTLVNKKEWEKLVTSCTGLHFFQSHGKNDALLGFNYAENLYDMLTSGGMNGDFMSFNGGHEIPPKVIEKIDKYITSTLR